MTLRNIICSNCGDELDELSETLRHKVGPCCENLPAPWGRDASTGMYTASPGDGAPEDEVDDPDARDYIICDSCGSTEFELVREETRVYRVTYRSREQDPGAGQLFFSDYSFEDDGDTVDEETVVLRCADCSEPADYEWGWC